MAAGVIFGTGPIALGLTTEKLGTLGLLVIRLLKALAAPLIFFAIVDGFLKTRIRGRDGRLLVGICLFNVTVAFAIGLFLVNTLRPGDLWRGHVDEMLGLVVKDGSPNPLAAAAAARPTLDPWKNVTGYVPESLLEPFVKNHVIGIVLLALLFGVAVRHVSDERSKEVEVAAGPWVVAELVHSGFQILLAALEKIVAFVPFAVFCLVAQVVGRSGLGVFKVLWVFLAVLLAGLLLHSLVYYTLAAWLVGRKPPNVFLKEGLPAILTGLSINSSLATLPLTLKSLSRMGVSDGSARLGACVGTQLNNDGITLYEAMAALFLAQACGFELSLAEQAVVVVASLMAGIGISGIPEAGLIVLPLVLSAAGLPEVVVAAAIPLIVPVDWIIARVRSGVNVMADMLVSILLDRFRTEE